METGIRVGQPITSMRPHKPSPSLNKRTEIVKMLTNLSLRRQAAADPRTLALFAADLEHLELADIETATKELSSGARRDGETAFPDLGTILEAVKSVVRTRKSQNRESEASLRWLEHIERCKAEEMGKPDAEMLAKIEALNRKMGIERRGITAHEGTAAIGLRRRFS